MTTHDLARWQHAHDFGAGRQQQAERRTRWALGLVRDSAAVLLDAEDHGGVVQAVEEIIAALPDHEIADLHVWRIGPASRACILSLVTHSPQPLERYRQRLAAIRGLDHVTIEINHCRAA